MAKLKLAVITDVHYGPDSGAKLGSKAPRLLTKFTKAANLFQPDAVIDIGDRITASNKSESTANMKSVKDHFNKIAAPTYSVLGNHDVKYMTRPEIEAVMGVSSESYSRDVNGYHLVFWNADVDPDKNEGLHASKEDIEWLKADIDATDKPTIVFSHVPLDNTPDDNERVKKLRDNGANPFFYPEGKEIRAVPEQSGKVILCMSGHLHRHRHQEINGIHYFIQQSLTQQWKKEYRIPHGSFSLIEIEDDKIEVRLAGKSRISMDNQLKKSFTLTPRPLS